MYVRKYVCMYVWKYIGNFMRTDHFFLSYLRGLLTFAGPTPVLIKNNVVLVFFDHFSSTSRSLRAVLIKMCFWNFLLTRKFQTNYLYEDHIDTALF